MLSKLRWLAITAAALVLSACGGSSSDDPAVYRSSASPALGLIRNATVNFYQRDNSTLIATTELGTDGVIAGPVTGYGGPVIIEVLGDDVDADYFDESTGTFRPFPAGTSMHAIAPGASGTFAVTPLTEIAYQGAVAQGLFPISRQAVNALNEEVRSVFVPFVDDILAPPTTFDNNTTSGSLADTSAGRYALFLAALAELGDGEASPALAVFEALIEDLEDGDIDGQNGDGAVATPYTPGSFSSELLSLMDGYADDFGDTSLQTSVDSFTSTSTVDFSDIENPPTGGGGSAGCNTACQSFFAGKADTYSGVPDEEVENGALALEFSGQSYDVVIATDGTITVSGESTDFTFSPSEITLFESSTETNVLYTDVESGYNVILQEDGPAFFLNINEPFEQGDVIQELANATLDLTTGEGGGGEVANLNLIQALAGTYTVTDAQSSPGTHTRGTVIIDANGNIDFDTGTSFTASTDYETIYDRLFIEQDPQVDLGPAYYVSMVFPENGGDDGDRVDIFFSDGTASTVTAFKYAPVSGTAVIVEVVLPE